MQADVRIVHLYWKKSNGKTAAGKNPETAVFLHFVFRTDIV